MKLSSFEMSAFPCRSAEVGMKTADLEGTPIKDQGRNSC